MHGKRQVSQNAEVNRAGNLAALVKVATIKKIATKRQMIKLAKMKAKGFE